MPWATQSGNTQWGSPAPGSAWHWQPPEILYGQLPAPRARLLGRWSWSPSQSRSIHAPPRPYHTIIQRTHPRGLPNNALLGVLVTLLSCHAALLPDVKKM